MFNISKKLKYTCSTLNSCANPVLCEDFWDVASLRIAILKSWGAISVFPQVKASITAWCKNTYCSCKKLNYRSWTEAAFSGISNNTLLCVWLTAVKYRKVQVWGCLGVQQMLLCFHSILQASHSFIKMFRKERKITNLWNANSLH